LTHDEQQAKKYGPYHSAAARPYQVCKWWEIAVITQPNLSA